MLDEVMKINLSDLFKDKGRHIAITDGLRLLDKNSLKWINIHCNG